MIHPTNESALKYITETCESNFVDLHGGSDSAEAWGKVVKRTYQGGDKRPELMVLVLERHGECYRGAMYITKEDFDGR